MVLSLFQRREDLLQDAGGPETITFLNRAFRCPRVKNFQVLAPCLMHSKVRPWGLAVIL